MLPSAWENFPHTVVEALAVGCPVIATAVGGVPEVVRDGENGLLVPPNDSAALGAAIARFFSDDAPARAARCGRAGLGRRLLRAGRVRDDRGGAREGGVRMKKRLLMVGRSRYSLPLSPSLEQKFAALSAELDVRVLAAEGRGGGADPRFQLVRPIRPRALDGPAFYASLPFRVARELRDFRPDAVLAQGAQEAALCVLGRTLARVPTKVIADIHGDPAAPARLYGSSSRRLLAPLADALARYGLRRSDGVRTISAYTSGLVREAGVEPTAEFAAFMDLEPFLEGAPVPLPERPVALFVGVLERYKAVDVLADAWRLAAPRVPEAALHLVGRGTLREVPDAPRCGPPRTDALDGVAPDDRRSLERSTRRVCSCCRRDRRVSAAWSSRPSAAAAASSPAASGASRTSSRTATTGHPRSARRSRGARGRARAGLSEIALSPKRLGTAAHAAVQPWLATPEEYARRIRELVDAVTG